MFIFLNDEVITPDQIDSLSASKGSTLNLTIIQAKNELGFGEDALMKWKTVSENLLDSGNSLQDYTGRYSEDVLNQFQLFRDAFTKLIRSQIRVVFKYYYVTLAHEVHPNTQHQADELGAKSKRCILPQRFLLILLPQMYYLNYFILILK